MSVTINSGVLASVSYQSGLTTPPLIINTPGAGGSTISISDVTGLTAALDAKLDDFLTPVGTTVTTTGADLNLLSGLSGYGLTTTDLQKLADINTATATELDFTAGVTGPIQAQLDAKLDLSGGTMTGTLDLGGQAFLLDADGDTWIDPSVDDIITIRVGGTDLYRLDSVGLDMGLDGTDRPIVNVLDPVNPQDAATRNYVDTEIAFATGGSFLPLAGGTMTGDIQLNATNLLLDADNNSSISAAVDDEMLVVLGGVSAFNLTQSSLDLFNATIKNVTDPVNPQDAATRNYVDTNFLALTGGTMTGVLDMDGQSFILDADGDTGLNSTADDVVTLTLGSGEVFSWQADDSATDTGFNAGGVRLTNLTDPINANDAATLDWVGTNYLALSGGTMSGALDLGGQTLSSPADPVAGNEVGDRDYNDTRYLQITNDLSDLSSAVTARANLGLSTVAATGDYNDLINQPTPIGALDDLTDVNVGTPGAPEDGFVLTWNNSAGDYDLQATPVASVFGRTGVVVPAAGDYAAVDITNAPAGNIAATDVQTAINELDAEKLALVGGTMTGSINMGGNSIINVGPVDLSGNLVANNFDLANVGTIDVANGSAAAPSVTFTSDSDTGMYWDSTNSLGFSAGGAPVLSMNGTNANFAGQIVSNIGGPVADTDAVNLGYLNARGFPRVLGSSTGVDMNGSPGSFPLFTVPVGDQYVITQIIVVVTSYVPGVAPTDPIISVGLLGGTVEEVLSNIPISLGPAGSADQAVYFEPDNGALTPNAGDNIGIQLVTSAGGTITAYTANVYVMGFEL